MYKVKTHVTDESVRDFISEVNHQRKREDSFRLLDIFAAATGMKPRMWGASMVGFGRYHYRYDSGHEGDAMMLGFAPGKAKISLYLAIYTEDGEEALKKLGKHTRGKSCVYINKLDDIDVSVLQELIRLTVAYMEKHYDTDRNA